MDCATKQFCFQEEPGELRKDYNATAYSDTGWTPRIGGSMAGFLKEACLPWYWYEGQRLAAGETR